MKKTLPTLDEYHNMKGKKEDDDRTQKPTNESTRVDHFANPLAHVELELPFKTLESNQKVKEEGRAMKTDITMISMYVMYFVLFRVTSGGFDTLMYNLLLWKMNK